VGYWDALREAFSELRPAIADGPLIHEMPENPWPWRVIIWPFVKPQQILAISGFNQYEDLKRVTTFFPDEWAGSRMSVLMIFLVTTIASAFGGIHLFGWSFIFPSSLEQTLWRLASVSITVVPILSFSFTNALSGLPDEHVAQHKFLFFLWNYNLLITTTLFLLCFRPFRIACAPFLLS